MQYHRECRFLQCKYRILSVVSQCYYCNLSLCVICWNCMFTVCCIMCTFVWFLVIISSNGLCFLHSIFSPVLFLICCAYCTTFNVSRVRTGCCALIFFIGSVKKVTLCSVLVHCMQHIIYKYLYVQIPCHFNVEVFLISHY